MKFKYCDAVKQPVVIDDYILRCYCHEPLVLKGVAQLDLGFVLDNLPWAMVHGQRDDSVLVFNIKLPYVWLLGPRAINFDRGDFVCDLIFHKFFPIRFDTGIPDFVKK